MKGSTLIETLVYIGLLSILLIGVFSSVYMVMGSEEKANTELEDAGLLNKIYE